MGFDKYTSTASVKAEQIEEARSVITPNGPLAAAPGQWEVRYPDGNVQVVDDVQFTATFEKGAAEEEEAEDVKDTTVEPEPEKTPNSELAEDELESEPKTESRAEKTATKAPPRTR